MESNPTTQNQNSSLGRQIIYGFKRNARLNYNPGTFDNYLNNWVDATAGGRFVPEGITSPVVNTSVLT